MSTISSIKLNGTSYKIKGFNFNLVENNTPQQLDEFNIIYLTEEEYQSKLEAGTLDETAMYCTDFSAEEGSSPSGGGTAGQNLNYLPLAGGTVTGVTTFSNTTASSSTTTGAVKISGGLGVVGNIYGEKVYGAVWNDYAEYRICKENFKPGQVVVENGDDTLRLSKERLQQDGYIVSDTFGFAIGETEETKCPVAVIGRVLAYTDGPRENFKPGEAVCAGINGTVSKMSREEIKEYPERIIGTVSAIPEYETWGTGNVKVDGRIWIRVR